MTDLVRALGTPALPGSRFAAWQFSALAGLLDASERVRRPVSTEDNRELDALRAAARAVAGDSGAGENDRIAAIRLLGRESTRRDEDRDLLAGLLRPQVSGPLQQAAVSALGRTRDPRVPTALLTGWKWHSPQVRGAVLDALLSRDTWTAELLSSLEDLCTPAAEIDPTHRRRLLEHRDLELRSRAEAVFDHEPDSRQKVVDAYRPALALRGDPAAGAAVFKKACAICHRLGGEGTDVGPDLAALADRSPSALLVAILDPNRAFEAKYTDFTIQTTDGRILNGLVAAETGSSVTLRRQEGKEDVLLRSEIDAMAASGRSLMPEGLENDIKPQDLADLIAYLSATGPPPRQVAGNHPERVAPRADGSIVLGAETAQIFGETLTFEAEHRNLGYWGRAADRAAWTFEVQQAGRYAVWLEWACDDASAGNTLLLDFGTDRVTSKVAGTGGWETYHTAKVGEVTLAAGANRLDARSEGRVRGALLDLRAVELRPLGDRGGHP
jgi:putative heme-binding domain-containing protein